MHLAQAPTPPAQKMPGKEEGKEKNEEELEQRKASQQMGPFQRVLFLILLGFGVQLVKAEDLEMSMHRTIEQDLFPAIRAEIGN